MGRRKNVKKLNNKKTYYQATYRDIYWEENDKMRENINKMFDKLSEAEKEFLKKIVEKTKSSV